MPITTIQITETQKETLDEFKLADGETYQSVLGRLIESHRTLEGGSMDDHSDSVDELREDIDRLQELVEQAPERTADELEGRLR